ncbi:MAG TPA: extracellular solute-binding protein [Chloroflexota bacterium]|nr:extracellular solute-binding protein [Chloroflexota bacterium]
MRIKLLVSALLSLAFLAACGTSGAASSSSPAGAAKPAASTSTITVYGALTTANGAAFAKAFEATSPGTSVQVIAAGSGALMSRIVAEQKAGGVKADVILLADPTAMDGLVSEGLTTAYEPNDASKLPATLRGKGWVGAFTFNNVILARKGLAPAPKDWSDLVNQAYKGAIEIGDPAYSGTTLAMVGVLSDKLGWDYFRNLQKLGARAVQSTNTVGTDVAGGQMQVGISLDSVGRDLVKKGSPVDVVWPVSGTVPVPAPVALVKGHDSPAAKAFLDWLISADGQATSVKLGYAPAYGPSAAVPAGTKTIDADWAKLLKNRDQTLKTFKSIFG